jgi:hypothetical protein
MASNSATHAASQQSVKAYIDAQNVAQALTFVGDDSTGTAVNSGETFQIAGGTGLTSAVVNDTMTLAIDSTVATLTGSQTLTNKVLTNPTINAFSGTGNGSITGSLSIVTTTTDDSFLITTTEATNNAAPVITLKRNSSSPADADYLGRIKFKGENDADQEVQYGSISGKIIDASDGTEDGALEFNVKKAGSNTIALRLNSDELKLLNGTTLDVNGAGIFGGSVTATSITANDFTSNGSNADITVAPQGTGDINLTAGADVNIPANIGITFGNDGEKIEGDGTDLTINSSGDVIMKLGGEQLILHDGTSNIGQFDLTSNHLAIEVLGNEKDMFFKGFDGGASITALTLDMSAAGAATFNSTVTLGTNNAIQFVDANESVKSDGTNLIFTSGGTTFKMPTADGNSGDVLKTDGSGTLSFASSTATASDDTRAVTKNNKSVSTSARTVDYFQKSSADMAWYFVAINDLTNDRSSASCFTVAHNDTDAFVSGPRGGSSSSNNSLPSTTADMSSDQVRVKITAPSDDSKISYYKIPISTANTANETAGVTVTTANTDVDSSSETIDSFAHATFRAAKYTILIDNNAKTETGVIEALVVHDGSTAFISQYGLVNTGSNDMITLTAQVVSANVVVSAAGLEPNLSLKIHKTLLSDSMSAVSNANQKIIGATTVSSSATAFDNFDLDDATAAMYYVVGGNSSEGHFSVYEVFCAGAPGEASVTPGSYVSTKGTTQLGFTAGFKSDADNSLELSVSSTSGGSTVVNAYRINCLAE